MTTSLIATSVSADDQVELLEAFEECREQRSCDRVENAFKRCTEEKVGCTSLLRAMGYPRRALDECMEGNVQLRIEVGDEGKVVNAAVTAASPVGYFEDSAIATVQGREFDVPSGSMLDHVIEYTLPVPCELRKK